MKKRNLSKRLNLQKSQVAILNASSIIGGRPDRTSDCRTLLTLYLKCSQVFCYTDVECYHTETCDDPVTFTGADCETIAPNC